MDKIPLFYIHFAVFAIWWSILIIDYFLFWTVLWIKDSEEKAYSRIYYWYLTNRGWEHHHRNDWHRETIKGGKIIIIKETITEADHVAMSIMVIPFCIFVAVGAIYHLPAVSCFVIFYIVIIHLLRSHRRQTELIQTKALKEHAKSEFKHLIDKE